MWFHKTGYWRRLFVRFVDSISFMSYLVFNNLIGFLYPDSKYEIINYDVLRAISTKENKLEIIIKV